MQKRAKTSTNVRNVQICIPQPANLKNSAADGAAAATVAVAALPAAAAAVAAGADDEVIQCGELLHPPKAPAF